MKGSERVSDNKFATRGRESLNALKTKLVMRLGARGYRRAVRIAAVCGILLLLLLLAVIFVRIEDIEVTGDVVCGECYSLVQGSNCPVTIGGSVKADKLGYVAVYGKRGAYGV